MNNDLNITEEEYKEMELKPELPIKLGKKKFRKSNIF